MMEVLPPSFPWNQYCIVNAVTVLQGGQPTKHVSIPAKSKKLLFSPKCPPQQWDTRRYFLEDKAPGM